MLSSAARGRHRHRPRIPALSYVIVVLALAALAVTLAWVTAGGPADAVLVADQARAVPAALPAVAAEPVSKAQLARAREAAASALAARTYTVRAGDSLSAVAARRCGSARDWTGIYAASRARRWTAGNANVLRTGQHLYISCAFLPGQIRFAAAPPLPAHAVAAVAIARAGGGADPFDGHHGACGDGDGDGLDAPCATIFPRRYGGTVAASTGTYHRSYRHPYRHHYRASGTYRGSGSMEQCIISRESGGNSQVMNSSSHYGLYQFSYSTWVSSGGNGADFGHASVAEQRRVFQAAVAARGYSDWTPYDGC